MNNKTLMIIIMSLLLVFPTINCCSIWQPRYLQVERRVKVVIDVYSNIDIDAANITYSYDVPLRTDVTITQKLKKGWNSVVFEEVGFSIDAEAEVTAQNVGNEEIAITTTNNFIYNSTLDCYENSDIELCFENKPLNSDYNWESFPKLNANTNNNNATLNFIGELVSHVEPTYSPFYDILGYGASLKLLEGNWTPGYFWLNSTDGIKMKLDTANGTRYYEAFGTVVSPTTTIPLVAGWNWIGYWLPHSQMSDVAFGSDWDKVKYMKSENWHYTRPSVNPRSGGDIIPLSNTPKPLHYGEGYMVYLTDSITNFSYQSTAAKSKTITKPAPTNFTFEVKADYEAIDFVELDPAISEIGVFSGDVCLGAVVVENSSEQVLVYSEYANRNPTPFHFEIITARGKAEIVSHYSVLDLNSGIFEDEMIIAGKNEYTVVNLGVKVEEEDLTPSLNRLHGNYLNPFNPSGAGRGPSTKISFSINETTKIELDIFNTKGQKIKTLYSGSIEAGEHTIEWNGKDNNNKPVSSGIYLYRLKDANSESTRKMILMK